MNDVQHFRLEQDSIGIKEVPSDAYYGVQTLRAVENFAITGQRVQPEMIRAIAEIKKAAALCNRTAGHLTDAQTDAICEACDEIIAGKWRDQFPIDPIQGGAGTSMNMNANEVIANRANELMGGKLGQYDRVHPNDHVNFGQSTNDVYPSCGKIAAYRLLENAQSELKALIETLDQKAKEFDSIIKIGRTQLQDAVPIRLGQEFAAYADALRRDMYRFDLARKDMLKLNLGGTAVGTCLNADPVYLQLIGKIISDVTHLPFSITEDLVDGTQNLDCWPAVSGVVKTCAVNLSKMANDLRLMASGPRTGLGEINLPARQNGSSIMPGKVNPVIPEVMTQIAFNIIGNDMTVTMAAEAGQLDLNAFEPIIFYNLFESLHTLANGVHTLRVNCVAGITANKAHCRDLVDNSISIITVICPQVGYQRAADIAKEALATGRSVRQLLIEKGLFSDAQLDVLLEPFRMTKPAVSDADCQKVHG